MSISLELGSSSDGTTSVDNGSPCNLPTMQTRLRVEVGKKGILNSLRWVERPQLNGATELTPLAVSIEVEAAGMNFKNTLIAMGLVPNHSNGFGLICAGIVTGVGSEVYATHEFAVGDRVMAVTVDTLNICRIMEFLMANFGILRNRIFSSRDTSFVEGIMRETGNHAVDIVLNSLSGELLHASWQCVAELGSMIELGKRDSINQGRLAIDRFEDNRSFFGLDAGGLINKRAAKMKDILNRCIKLYQNGYIQPILPITLFDAIDMPMRSERFRKGSI
ncbi:hypothetical protein B0H66DRAFT_601001 [Apodospora peruviana]|uniref:Enoyl reductase (ER) domain-containing protein n=1 Tax=Apodospora peruviana TaxID=516989 RepID=A0AAE0IM64_9PEZI|nr:hypothetical protein B0H66DRAFT_601001 [Apodospora peruviana]